MKNSRIVLTFLALIALAATGFSMAKTDSLNSTESCCSASSACCGAGESCCGN